MSETKPPSTAAEKMAKELKSTLVQRRPQPWKTVLITLALCTLTLAALSYWFYPRPRFAPLQIVALEGLCTPEEKLRVRAQLYDVTPDKSPRRMSGHTALFVEPPPLLHPAVETLKIVTESDEQGQAVADWPTPKTAFALFRAEHIDLAEKARSLDHARVFVFAKDASLLVVDVDETLKADALDVEAEKTLARAVQEGWQVVYLAVAGERPVDYRKTRDWVIVQPTLPRGPILGRSEFTDAQTGDAARRAWFKSLRARFTGNLAAIVRSADAALAAMDAGVATYQISAEPIAGVVGIASWTDVPVRLKK